MFSSFVPWSLGSVSNIPIDKYHECLTDNDKIVPPLVHEDVEDYIRKSGGKIIERKGATFYAVAVSVCHIVSCISAGTDTTLTVSSMLHGEYGISDVCLSTLSVIGRNGIRGRFSQTMKLKSSERVLMFSRTSLVSSILTNR